MADAWGSPSKSSRASRYQTEVVKVVSQLVRACAFWTSATARERSFRWSQVFFRLTAQVQERIGFALPAESPGTWAR